MATSTPLVIWRFTDGKPGHQNQSLGLVESLAERVDVKVYDIEPLPTMAALKAFLKKSFPLQGRPAPKLIIGVGHATHLSVLAARRSVGGRSVILMKPSLPTFLFDYCVIPEHDGVRSGRHVITTTGVLNRVRPSSQLDDTRGLILVGGPSKHYDWHDAPMIERIAMIVAQHDIRWTLSTSRRTPQSFLQQLDKVGLDKLKVVPVDETGPNWLAEQLKYCGAIWISEDSVSMVYEALSSGATCGLLPVQRKRDNRVSSGVDGLVKKGLLTSFDDWTMLRKFKPGRAPLSEAGRIADLLLQHV